MSIGFRPQRTINHSPRCKCCHNCRIIEIHINLIFWHSPLVSIECHMMPNLYHLVMTSIYRSLYNIMPFRTCCTILSREYFKQHLTRHNSFQHIHCHSLLIVFWIQISLTIQFRNNKLHIIKSNFIYFYVIKHYAIHTKIRYFHIHHTHLFLSIS